MAQKPAPKVAVPAKKTPAKNGNLKKAKPVSSSSEESSEEESSEDEVLDILKSIARYAINLLYNFLFYFSNIDLNGTFYVQKPAPKAVPSKNQPAKNGAAAAKKAPSSSDSSDEDSDEEEVSIYFHNSS